MRYPLKTTYCLYFFSKKYDQAKSNITTPKRGIIGLVESAGDVCFVIDFILPGTVKGMFYDSEGDLPLKFEFTGITSLIVLFYEFFKVP